MGRERSRKLQIMTFIVVFVSMPPRIVKIYN